MLFNHLGSTATSFYDDDTVTGSVKDLPFSHDTFAENENQVNPEGLYDVHLSPTRPCSAEKSRINLQFGKICQKTTKASSAWLNLGKSTVQGWGETSREWANWHWDSKLVCTIFSAAMHRIVMILLLLIVAIFAFAQVTSGFMLVLANKSGNQCVANTNSLSAPYVASAIQIQALKGLNATIWNVKQTMTTNVDEILDIYSHAYNVKSNASNFASRNATLSLASWSNITLSNIINITEYLQTRLNKVGEDIGSSTSTASLKFNQTSANLTVPTGFATLSTNFSFDSTLGQSAKSIIVAQSNSAINQLQTLSFNKIPILNTTLIPGCGFEYERLNHDITPIKTAWLVTISVLVAFFILSYVVCVNYADGAEGFRDRVLLYIDTRLQKKLSEESTETIWAGIGRICNDVSLRLLVAGATLILLGVAFETLLIPMRKAAVIAEQSGTREFSEQVWSLYSSHQNDINNQCYTILSGLITNLSSSFTDFIHRVEAASGLELGGSFLYGNGVALEHIDFPLPYRPTTNANLLNITDDVNLIYPILNQLAIGLWVSGLVIISGWIFYVSFICISKFCCLKTKRQLQNAQFS